MAESTTENPTTMTEEQPTTSAMTTTTTEQQSTEAANATAPPTKSNTTTTTTTTSTTTDFEPPAACIRRLLKQTLPKSTNISKDSLSALSRASGIFILYLTACANDVAREGRRTTIVAKDVIGALKELDFEEFVPAMEKFLEGHRREERSKKEEKERMKQRSASLDGSVGGVVEKRDKGGKFVSGSGGGGKGDEDEEEEHNEVKNDNMEHEEAVKLLGEQKQNEEHKISPAVNAAVNAADASSGEKHPRQEEEQEEKDDDDEGKSLPSKKQRMEGEE